MKTYRIAFGSGLAWPVVCFETVEEWQSEGDAIDKMIDGLELCHGTNIFLTPEELSELNDAEYFSGGNHGLSLRHYGIFNIERI